MINKKIIISLVVLSICCLFGFSFAEDKPNNFVTIANGGGTRDLNTTTLGQAIVFAQITDRNIAKSGYASVIMSSKSEAIVFTDKTEQKTFDTNIVPVEIEVKMKENYDGEISQMAYKVGAGESPDFNKIEATEYTVSPSTSVIFKKNIDFGNIPVSQVWLWAQYKNGNKFDSSYVIITVRTQASGSGVTLESPDPISRVSLIDPVIKTSKFSLEVSSVTVRLYEGRSRSGNPLYEVTASSDNTNGIFNEDESCIHYLNSDILGSTLKSNKEYTIVFEFLSGEFDSIEVTFKALSDGIADILTYPSPFNPKKEKVKIRYLLGKDANVTIKLYDKAGKIVSKLIQSEHRSAGINEEEWDGRNYAGETLATGAYIVEIIANGDRRYTALAIVGK